MTDVVVVEYGGGAGYSKGGVDRVVVDVVVMEDGGGSDGAG